MQRSMQCPICLGDVVLPVHFTCFSCECSETYCVCWPCGRRHLHMDSDEKGKRGGNGPPKCLYCPVQVSTTDESRCFRKNRIYMQQDPTVYPCIDAECDFKGSQCELERHLDKDCRSRRLRCPCGASFQANHASSHYTTCCHYKICGVCEEHVPVDDLPHHRRIRHDLVACPYVGCPEVVPTNRLHHHTTTSCGHRLVSCPVCQQKRRAKDMRHHLEDHRTDVCLERTKLETKRKRVEAAWDAWTEK